MNKDEIEINNCSFCKVQKQINLIYINNNKSWEEMKKEEYLLESTLNNNPNNNSEYWNHIWRHSICKKCNYTNIKNKFENLPESWWDHIQSHEPKNECECCRKKTDSKLITYENIIGEIKVCISCEILNNKEWFNTLILAKSKRIK